MQVYKMSSTSGRDVARGLGLLRLRTKNSRFKPRSGDLVLNWGSSKVIPYVDYINSPYAVENAINKEYAFELMEACGVSIPDWTTDYHTALGWKEEGSIIVARSTATGTKGRGISIVYEEDVLPEDCALYVKYIKKNREFRVHVVDGEVIDVVQKKVRSGSTGNNFQVRSYANGWIFAREGIQPPDSVLKEAQKAVQALSLDFGAVDVVYNDHQERAYVLEVNTAPGLDGPTSLHAYLTSLGKLIGISIMST